MDADELVDGRRELRCVASVKSIKSFLKDWMTSDAGGGSMGMVQIYLESA